MSHEVIRGSRPIGAMVLVSTALLAAYGFAACGSDDAGGQVTTTTTTSSSGVAGGGGVGGGHSSGGQGGGFSPEVDPCEGHAGEIICVDDDALSCDANGETASVDDCADEVCLPGTGCVLCIEGQFACAGNAVLSCNVGPPRSWDTVATCNALTEVCNATTGVCVPLTPTGNTNPTGTYYQYARFTTANSAFLGGCDVDSFEDHIYVNRNGSVVDAYTVQLLDSDGDGEMEPNQHPDNPDDPGPIEERVLTLVTTYDVPEIGNIHQSEIYATDDSIYFLNSSCCPGDVFMYVFSSGTTSKVVESSNLTSLGSHNAMLGFDEVEGRWYTGSHYERQVWTFDTASSEWATEFKYPNLGGDHMDGMEIVTDPNTGIVYAYVSDMTSDFLGQYRKDRGDTWVQENLFQYAGTADAVEGMGFGALNHFWMNGWNPADVLYEIGGGDLAKFVEPIEDPK